MYFENRADAGRKLAQRLLQYSPQNCVVLAINPGGVLVGAQIAIELHASLFMLATERITLPGEIVPFGAVSSDNTFTHNPDLSEGQKAELQAEYHSVIESERRTKLKKLHSVMGPDGEIPRDMLRRRTIILVSDGFTDGFDLNIAADFLKPIEVTKLVIASPFAGVDAVDAMHLQGDAIECLSIIRNFFGVDHYYDDNTIPDTDGLHKIMKNTSLVWNVS